jgi:hypothetical protein
MGTVFSYKRGWRFKYRGLAGEWQTVTSKASTKAEAALSCTRRSWKSSASGSGSFRAPRTRSAGRSGT